MDAQVTVARNVSIPIMACKKPHLASQSNGRILNPGPFDGCQSFEERRWLIRNFSPSVADGYPVLGKDERPHLSFEAFLDFCNLLIPATVQSESASP